MPAAASPPILGSGLASPKAHGAPNPTHPLQIATPGGEAMSRPRHHVGRVLRIDVFLRR
jgi:hypothetical protein